MSHIPSAAMPHAKPHDPAAAVTPAPRPRQEPLPWAALAVGGVLAIGGAITAAWLLRGGKEKKPARKAAARRTPAKAAGKTGTRKPRKAKTADAAS